MLSHVQELQPLDHSQPGSPVHGVSQATALEEPVISFPRIFPIQGSNISGRLFLCHQGSPAHFNRLQYEKNFTFTCPAKTKNSWDWLYCDSHFTVGGLELNTQYLKVWLYIAKLLKRQGNDKSQVQYTCYSQWRRENRSVGQIRKFKDNHKFLLFKMVVVS